MKWLEEDIKTLEEAINKDYSLDHLLELYKSGKYEYFYFSKKSKIIFLIISILITIFWLINYLNIVTVIWLVWISYFSYSVWMVKWYNVWVDEWLREWFEIWFVNIELDLLKKLLKKKKEEKDNPEKALINILLMALSGRFWDYNDLLKDKQNKNMIEFKLNKIIEREKDNYWR